MHPYFVSEDTLAPHARLTSFLAFRPSARSSKGIFHKIQDSSRKFSVCAQGSSVDSSMILLCLYIFIECV